jgi:LPS-assembly protein
MPISRWLLEGRLEGGIRQTSYLVQEYGDGLWLHSRNQNRTTGRIEGDLATTLTRDFDVRMGSIKSLSHAFRPSLGYSYIPSVNQDTLPDIDVVDRLDPRNWITYSLNNHFNVREGAEAGSRYLGYFRVNQTWDIREDRRTVQGPADRQRPFSDVLFELDIRPLERLRLNFESSLSSYGQGVTYYKILSSYTADRGRNLFVDFNYQRDPEASRPFFYIDRPTVSERRLTLAFLQPLTRTILVQGDHTEIWRTEEGRGIREVSQGARLIYQPTCWAVELQASKSNDDNRVAIVFSLTGIGDLLGVGLDGSRVRYDLL